MDKFLISEEDPSKSGRPRARLSMVPLTFAVLAIVFNFSPVVSALTNNQLNVFNSGIPYFNTEICGGNTSSSTSTTLVGGDNIQKAFNYFVSKGLTPAQSAGIVGNFEQESGVDPASVQQGGGPGRGIAQWSVGQRWDGPGPDSLKAFLAGGNMTDLLNQLNFAWFELTTQFPKALSALKATTTAGNAAVVISDDYEFPNPKYAQIQNRINFANQILQQYGGGSAANTFSQSCGVQCNSGTSTTSSNLSPTRQAIVCLAKQELAAWTPPPKIPRLEYTKYSDGQECDVAIDLKYPSGCVPTPPSLGTQEWCADFVSWIYMKAGDQFKGGTSGGWRLVNIFQIRDAGMTDPRFHWHSSQGYTPQPGDVAVHSNPATGFGHVNIVISVSGNTITAIGGDQGGGWPGGPFSGTVVSIDQYTGSTGESTIGYTTPD